MASLKQLIDVNKVATKWVEQHPVVSKSPESNSASAWVDLNFNLDSRALKAALKQIYGSGWAFGSNDAMQLLNIEIADPWDDWKAGNEAAAALVNPPNGLKNLLNKSGTTIDGISQTVLDQLGTQLAVSLEQGLGAEQTAQNLSSVIDNPLKAMVIARTETARAICDSNVTNYRENGVTQMRWITADPCNICAENENKIIDIGDTFPTGDEYPPAHPNCVCDVSPVSEYSDVQGSGSSVSDDGVERVSVEGDDDVIHDGIVNDSEKFVSNDLNKYSPDQPRDERGRFGSGGDTETSNSSGTTITQDNAVQSLVVPQLDARNITLPDGMEETDLTNKDQWNDLKFALKDQGAELKSGLAEDLAKSDAMKDVSTQQIVDLVNDGIFERASGEGSDFYERYAEELNTAITPAQTESYDENGELVNGINVVSLTESGEIEVWHWTDALPYQAVNKFGLKDGEATPEQIQKACEWTNAHATELGSAQWHMQGTGDAEESARIASSSALVQAWASTSNNSYPASLAIQEAAREQFGLTNAAEWRGATPETQEATNRILETHGDVLRAYVQANYDLTQQFLQENNIKELTVFRGVADPAISGASGEKFVVDSRPLSSWSMAQFTAEEFASREGGALLQTTIPASQVFSIAGSGVGCLHEFEVVTLGKETSAVSLPFKSLKSVNKSKKVSVSVDDTLQNSDWIKSLGWDLPNNPKSFLLAIGGRWEHFKTLPAYLAMSEHLKHDVEAYVKTQSLKMLNKYSPDQERDERGRFGSGSGGSVTDKVGSKIAEKTTALEKQNATITPLRTDDDLVNAVNNLEQMADKYVNDPDLGMSALEAVQFDRGYNMTMEALDWQTSEFLSDDYARIISIQSSDGEIAGAIAMSLNANANSEPTVELHYLGTTGIVDGAGSALFGQAISWANEQGSGIQLHALDSDAFDFWSSMGFVHEGFTDGQFRPNEYLTLDSDKVAEISERVNNG